MDAIDREESEADEKRDADDEHNADGEDAMVSFISAEKFQGSRAGFVFQMGARGLGYYADTGGATQRSSEAAFSTRSSGERGVQWKVLSTHANDGALSTAGAVGRWDIRAPQHCAGFNCFRIEVAAAKALSCRGFELLGRFPARTVPFPSPPLSRPHSGCFAADN